MVGVDDSPEEMFLFVFGSPARTLTGCFLLTGPEATFLVLSAFAGGSGESESVSRRHQGQCDSLWVVPPDVPPAEVSWAGASSPAGPSATAPRALFAQSSSANRPKCEEMALQHEGRLKG